MTWIDDITAEVHVDSTKFFTTVIVESDGYRGIGTAKRNPRDSFDERIGVDYARARALRDLADRFEDRAVEASKPKPPSPFEELVAYIRRIYAGTPAGTPASWGSFAP